MINFLLIYAKNDKQIPNKILSCFLKKESNQILFNCITTQYILSEDHRRLAIFYSSTDISKNVVYNSDKQKYSFFDGIILYHDKYTDDIHELNLDQGEYDHFWTTGNYCAGIFSETGTNFVHQSVLGTYALFWGETKDFFVISNNPHLIAHAIKRQKIPEINYNIFVGWLLDGVHYSLETVYRGVYYFPINAVAIITSKNEVCFKTITDKLYNKDTKIDFNKAYSNLFYTAKCIKNSDLLKTWGNITGGMDTRTVLSLINKVNATDRFNFSISGVEEHPDVKVAQMISEKLNIPLRIEKVENLNLSKEIYISNMQKNMFYFCASREIQEMGEREQKPILQIRIPGSGHFGEIIRSCAFKNLISPQKNKNSIDEVRKVLKKDSIITPKAIKKFFTQKIELLKRMPSSQEYSLIHGLIRLTRFHGGISYRNCFFLLANVPFGHLAMFEEYSKRKNDWFNFKIIEQACPELLKLPFANYTWSEFNYEGRSDANDFKKIVPCTSILPVRAISVSVIKEKLLRDFLLHPDRQIFKFFSKKEYWKYVKENIETKDPRIAYKLCSLLSPTFWSDALKKGKICSDTYAPIPTRLDANLISRQSNFFSEKDFGENIYTVQEIIKENHIILLSKDSPFNKNYLSEKECSDFIEKNLTNKIQKTEVKARIDITTKRKEDVCFFEVSSVETLGELSKPAWLERCNLTGVIYQSNLKKINLLVNVLHDCQLQLALRAEDKRKNNIRIPIWVKYMSFNVNGTKILNKPIYAWHDDAFVYKIDVKQNEKLKIFIEYRSLTKIEYMLHDLIFRLSKVKLINMLTITRS